MKGSGHNFYQTAMNPLGLSFDTTGMKGALELEPMTW